jgi:murein DD-endopeptidase MepM/ murein hydrolase activator NlpD
VRSTGRALPGDEAIDEREYLRVHRKQVAAAIAAAAVLLLLCTSFAVFMVARARAQAERLRVQAAAQHNFLEQIDRQTSVLRHELDRVQKQNQEIRQLIGAPAPSATPSPAAKTSWLRGDSMRAVAENVHTLSSDSEQTKRDAETIRSLAMHVLNIRHLHALQRAELLAAIPSIDPVAGAEVVGCYCYRTYPDEEFHPGVDLGADYGESVRAAAAGVVVSAGWDGGYGIKIDIDHGNGYHTWYAHLSHVDVAPGQRVFKGETIGAVGATGFATGPHLHYQIMYDGAPVNPTPFLHGVPPNVLASLP